MASRVVFEVIRYLLLALFVYTGASKMLGYPLFSIQIGLSPLLPSFMVSVAWLIPLVELVTGLFLLIPGLLRLGLMMSWILMLSFTFYVVAILTLAEHLPCSCGGVLASLSWGQHLVFNLVFLALATIAIGLDLKSQIPFGTG